MRRATPHAPLRVLLLCKTLIPRASGAWKAATAPWALGAFSLRRYVETLSELAPHVSIEIRSYAADESNELILHEIVANPPDVVGFTCQPWNHSAHLKLSRLIRQLLPEVMVLHGGPMVIELEHYLKRYGSQTLSVAFEGEAEHSFAEFLSHLVHGTPELEQIAGIAYFDANGAACVTRERAALDVSSLPPVMTPENLRAMGSYVLYETSRGCPFQCSFCNWGSQKARLRSRNREVIERDLKAILATPSVTHLWITDSGLDISREHCLFLADVIKRHRRHPINVSGYFFLLHADLSYVKQLKGAFDTLQLGLQTANDQKLSEMGRKALSVERFDRILDAVLPHYPDLRVDLIFGLPGVGPRELRDSVRFLLEKGIWLMNLFRLIAIPGTEMADNKQSYGIVADDDFPFNVYSAPGCSLQDLYAMQQFKVNFDTLRELFRGGTYQAALASGIDLVDFVDRLHTFVPRFNHLAEYCLESDRVPEPELLNAIYSAAEAYAETSRTKELLFGFLSDAFGPRPEQLAAPEPIRPEPDRTGLPPPLPNLREAPSSALRGLTVALSSVIGGFGEPASLEALLPRWERFIATSAHLDGLGLHVHVPFCRTICTYCDCATEALSDEAQIERYLEYLAAEIAEVSPIVARLELERLYVGGGTPNVLEAAQLHRLLGLVREKHRFRSGAVLCVESDPRHSTRAKLDVCKRHGVNRVSFGVQSANAAVLKRVNRGGQTWEMVAAAVRDAFEAGIEEVNLDYVFGLADEDAEGFVAGVRRGLELAPTTICVQLLNDSHFASPYRDAEHRRLVAEQFNRVRAALERVVAEELPQYELGLRPDTLVLARKDMWRDWRGHLEYYSARDRTSRSTIGYGRHAQSVLFGVLRYQNQDRTGHFDRRAPAYAVQQCALELECVADLVADLEFERRCDQTAGAAIYPREVLERVGAAVDALVEAGHLARSGSVIADAGLSEAGVTWLARRFLPDASPVPPAEGLGLVEVEDSGRSWSIHIEHAREGATYYRKLGGLGLFYRSAQGSLDGERAARIMDLVVRHVEGLIGRGASPENMPEEVARFLETLDSLGVRAKVVRAQRRRHRLTVLAPA